MENSKADLCGQGGKSLYSNNYINGKPVKQAIRINHLNSDVLPRLKRIERGSVVHMYTYFCHGHFQMFYFDPVK